MYLRYWLIIGFILFSEISQADDINVESLDETDAPNILYVVPWVDVPEQKSQAQKLVIHDLLNDLYEPQLPAEEE